MTMKKVTMGSKGPNFAGCATPTSRRRVTLSLNVCPYRFRDNMVGIRSGTSSIESIMLYFQRVLGVKLQVEGEGREWTNLEASVRIQEGQIVLFMKKKMSCQPINACSVSLMYIVYMCGQFCSPWHLLCARKLCYMHHMSMGPSTTYIILCMK